MLKQITPINSVIIREKKGKQSSELVECIALVEYQIQFSNLLSLGASIFEVLSNTKYYIISWWINDYFY